MTTPHKHLKFFSIVSRTSDTHGPARHRGVLRGMAEHMTDVLHLHDTDGDGVLSEAEMQTFSSSVLLSRTLNALQGLIYMSLGMALMLFPGLVPRICELLELRPAGDPLEAGLLDGMALAGLAVFIIGMRYFQQSRPVWLSTGLQMLVLGRVAISAQMYPSIFFLLCTAADRVIVIGGVSSALIAFQLQTIEFKLAIGAIALFDGSIGFVLWSYFHFSELGKGSGGAAQL